MIKIKSYLICNSLLTNGLLSNYIDLFWKDVFHQLTKGPSTQHLMLMCKIAFNSSSMDMGYRTLGHLRRVNYSDKELFTEYLQERLAHLNDSYTSNSLNEITFSYVEREGLASDKDRALLQDLSDKSITKHKFNNLNLPISMTPSDYGIILATTKFDTFTRYIVSNNKTIFQIDISLDGLINNVTILGLSDLKWTDTKLNEGFKREIGKSTIYFIDGEVSLRKQLLPAKPFRKLVPDQKLTYNFLTMDIETIKQSNGKLSPYLICAYDGHSYITSYNDNPKALFTSFIEQLTSKTNNKNLIIYAHNLSSFDGIFTMRHLESYGHIEPLLFNNKLMGINLKMKNGQTIQFKDSYLLLPESLRNLCSSFGVESSKGYFPFKLMNIFYMGVFPKFEYWTGIDLSEYELLKAPFKTTFWDFKKEAIKYCKLDCLSLHEVLTKFGELMFKEFQVDIHKSLTLPSLAMRIYKIHFMPKDTIYQLLGNVESAIRESYTGGAVDVYIPHNRTENIFTNIFRKLYYYDVNGLYPFIMANAPMPIGLPTYFEGNIRQVEPEAYGFFYCKITSPDNLEHPLLQRRIKTNDGVRTIAGLGTWHGWVPSVEMDNAIKKGYQFEIIKGYQFETGDLFSGYVNRMYELRLQYPKGNPMNLIAKLLMNSLYGKFGMKLERNELFMYNCSTEEGKTNFKDMLNLYGETLKDYIKIGEKYFIIRDTSINIKYNKELDLYHGQDVNIAIASAITAGARVHMSYFKNNPLFRLYYSDTDSVVIDKLLPIAMVGAALGLMKLEHVIDRAVFLAPKVYGFVNTDGVETIKVKGIHHEVASNIHIKDLEELLIEDSSRLFTQEKWFKKLIEGEIHVTDVIYTLKATSNKRAPIYIDGVYEGTKPYYYDEITSNK